MASPLNAFVLLSNENRIYALCGGIAAISSYAAWAKYQSSLAIANQDNFERTLEILGNGQTIMKKIQAKIDTGADYSLISRSIAEELGLPVLPLTEDDPVDLLLPDKRNFRIAGKVSILFHGINPRGPRLTFRFGKYENAAIFYIPADCDISGFDAYIGADDIHKLQLQKQNFFSSRKGFRFMSKPPPLSELQISMTAYDALVTTYIGNNTLPVPPLPDNLQTQVPSHLHPASGSRFSPEARQWAEDQRKADAKKKKEGSFGGILKGFFKRDDGEGSGEGGGGGEGGRTKVAA
ncbi:hypothetical protein EG328_005185 [Venturia inaequalis]|uniref:Peptidase A2 domain-containing protein n=1 Tax=Venturia inaequalis TaxID=5025 RepID=A0A8H3YW93_VENIN|nr:hypothetical protein EG328_005185 [Venturia inaequalis]